MSGTIYQARRAVDAILQVVELKAFYIICKEIEEKDLPQNSSKSPYDIIHIVGLKTLRGTVKHVYDYDKDSTWRDRSDRNMIKARESFNSGRNSLFLGAGFSQSMGLPGWEDLLLKLLKLLKENNSVNVNDCSAFDRDTGGINLVKARYLKSFYKESERPFISDIRKLLYQNDKKIKK